MPVPMFRLRRYRIFLGLALFAVIGLFFPLDSLLGTKVAQSTYQRAKGRPYKQEGSNEAQLAAGLGEALQQPGDRLVKDGVKHGTPDDDFPQINLPGEDTAKPAAPHNVVPDHNPAKSKTDKLAQEAAAVANQPVRVSSSSASTTFLTPSPIHWSKSPEFYPVPSESIIPLPSGKPKDIPRVQATFKPETAIDRHPRKEKQDDIKSTFLKHWQGYKKFAWDHDELLPVSGGFNDPFAGWRATLVDSLDTLWIMGLKEEFEEAVAAVKDIDFTTTSKNSLPVFEVVIRYLGGLLAAHDLSEGKYPILKEKAEQLGEVMISAFDTPNRMPITHFHWTPTDRSIPRLATSSAVLAELGSLCMEFTRLAQITKQNKYYDAVARITNNFYDWQNHTRLPGLWPLFVDETGGCNLPPTPAPPSTPNEPFGGAQKAASYHKGGPSDPRVGKDATSFGTDRNNPAAALQDPSSWHDAELLLAESAKSSFANEEKPTKNQAAVPGSRTRQRIEDREARLAAKGEDHVRKRAPPTATTADKIQDTVDCKEAGFTSRAGMDKFTIGVMADSAYEYLPKQWLLLGGLNDQYRIMHETAMVAVENYLLYRPMIEDSQRKLLFTGAFTTDGKKIDPATGGLQGSFDAETGHLSCFTGAYIGLGAKAMNRPKDLEMAKQLTDGCVWAYEETASGIMPETLSPVVCEYVDGPCPWNETRWHEAIDPNGQWRVSNNIKMEEDRLEHLRAASSTSSVPAAETVAPLDKRTPPNVAHPKVAPSTEPLPTTLPAYYKQRITNERLTPGVSRIGSRNYLLRPEAIESVFYMYRLTGDDEWRDKGWAMWQAVKKATDTTWGNSAIHDVTVAETAVKDNAESFWTGETLKYFYLLFSEPDLMSLDDWVLNTEAHPFRRPDAPAR